MTDIDYTAIAENVRAYLELRATAIQAGTIDNPDVIAAVWHDGKGIALTDTTLRTLVAEHEQLRIAVDRVIGRLRTDDPRAMINQRQVLGLLSPTWPNGNYEAPAPENRGG